MEAIKAKLGYKPKRKPNMVRWMTKHCVGASVVSLNHGITRAIESQQITEEYEKQND